MRIVCTMAAIFNRTRPTTSLMKLCNLKNQTFQSAAIQYVSLFSVANVFESDPVQCLSQIGVIST